jgi:hypothetical protein
VKSDLKIAQVRGRRLLAALQFAKKSNQSLIVNVRLRTASGKYLPTTLKEVCVSIRRPVCLTPISRNYLPYLSMTQKPCSLTALKRIRAILSSTRERQTMSIIIRVIVVATCAFAGSAVAGIQFSELPEQHQVGLR